MSIMDRNDAIKLLRSAGVEEAQINEDAILIATIVGTVIMRKFAKVLAERIANEVMKGVEWEGMRR